MKVSAEMTDHVMRCHEEIPQHAPNKTPQPLQASLKKTQTNLVGGSATPLKNMKVNWDDDIPNIWENKKMFQTTNQICIHILL